MPKFATEIAELVTARVTILNIWHFVKKLIIYKYIAGSFGWLLQ